MSDNWPAPIYSSNDEYTAAAALLGMDYDPNDHTFMPDGSGVSMYVACLCPETMEPAYKIDDDASSLATFGVQYAARKEAVQQGKLGPGAHSRDR